MENNIIENQDFFSPLGCILNVKNKTITITYTKDILREPVIAEHLKRVGEDLSELIEVALKREV